MVGQWVVQGRQMGLVLASAMREVRADGWAHGGVDQAGGGLLARGFSGCLVQDGIGQICGSAGMAGILGGIFDFIVKEGTGVACGACDIFAAVKVIRELIVLNS